MGYSRDLLTEIVLDVFSKQRHNDYLWEYADFLYSLKNYKYLDKYLDIIMNNEYGSSREMLVLLVGDSKTSTAIPYLLRLTNDSNMLGYALSALSNFNDDRILPLMKTYENHEVKWISTTCKKYIKRHSTT